MPAPEREIVAAILHRLAKAENKDKAATPDYQGLCELHVARINNLQAEVGCLRREIIPLSEAKQFHENAHNSIFQCNTHLSTENKQLRADCAALQAKLDDAQLKAIAWSDDNAKLKQRILDLGFKLKVKPAVPDYMAVLKRCMGGELTPEETTQTTITNECAFDALREAVLAHSVIPKVMEAAQAKANAKLDVALAEHMRATANKIVDDILTHGEGTGNPGSLWSTARPYTNESAGEFSNFPFTLADLREVKRNSDAGPYWTSLTIRKESTPGVAVKAANRMPVVASTDRSADNVAAKSTRPLQGVQVSNELLDDCILDLGSTLFKAPPTMSPREAAAFLHLGGRLVNPTDSSEFMAKADEDKLQLHKMSDCSISDTLLLTSSILEHLTVLHNHGLHLVRFVPSAGLKKQWRKQLKTQANAKGLTLEFPGDNTALLKGPGWELGYGADNFYSRVRSKLQAYEMPSKAAEPAEPAPGVRGGHMTWEQAKAAMHAGAAVRGEMFRAGVRILKAKDDKYPTLIAPGGYTRSYPFDDAALTDIKWFVFDEHLTTNQAIAAATEGAKIHKIGWPIGAYSACLYVLVGVPCLSCVDVTDVQAFADNSDDAMWVIVN